MGKRLQHGSTLIAYAALLSTLATPAWAQWPTTKWMAQPVLTSKANPGWVADAAQDWDGTPPPGIRVDTLLDGKTSWHYKNNRNKGTLQISPADRAAIRTGLESASALLQAQEFNAPLLERNHGYWLARIFPDPYIHDHGIQDTTDDVWGMYMSHKDSSGMTGRLYVGHDWRDDPGITFIHEMFHAVGASYPGHNATSDLASKGCAAPCWITEGMAEGFTGHWAGQGGSALLGKSYASRSGGRSFERPLPATEYAEGQNTAPFWQHVADRYGLRALSSVLNQTPSVEDDAVTSTDDGLREGGYKGLTPIFVQFVSEELTSPNDFKTIPVFNVSKKNDEVKKKIAIERLAASAFRVKVTLDRDQEGQLSIDASDGGDDTMHLLIGDKIFGAEAVIPLDASKTKHDFFVRLVNAKPTPAETTPEQPDIVVTLDLFECAMMPSPRVRALHYQQFDASETPIAKIQYDFSKATFSKHSVKNVKLLFSMAMKNASSKSEAIFSYQCTQGGVVSDGTYAMHGLQTSGPTFGKAKGKMTLTQEHNTLSLPNRPVLNEALPDGSAAFSAGFDGAPFTRISVEQTNRKITGREIIKVPGAGDLNTWKMTAKSSFGMNINADGIMSNPGGAANKSAMDLLDFIAKQAGKNLKADEKAVLSSQIAQAGQGSQMKNAMSMLSGAITQRAAGRETLWFHRGIGMVQHKSSNAHGDSRVQLMRVEYR